MTLTALTGSQLSARAEKRAQEAIRRREDMERLQQLGSVLLAAVTVSEAAAKTVRKLVIACSIWMRGAAHRRRP